MLDETFTAEDERFIDEFVRFHSYALLKAFVERWVNDDRPWARGQMVEYLNRDLNYPGHEVVFKRLFKHFEAAGDHEMMSVFMVTLDRLVRRARVKRFQDDWQTGRSWTEEFLAARPNKTIIDNPPETQPSGGRSQSYTYHSPRLCNRPGNRLFSHKTRNHLRRRVWRYFRNLSYCDSAAYLHHITEALQKYRDPDFESGENIIDNWSLMHACYFKCEAIQFGPAHTNLKPGHSLTELNPAPYRPELWQEESAVGHLTKLIISARSSLVRIWAMELLLSEHPAVIGQLDVHVLIKMLSHSDQRVQTFAVELFSSHPSLDNLPLSTWLNLLDEADPSVLHTICEAMKRHVAADRLDTMQLIQLACARPVPVAQFGFELLRTRHGQQALTASQVTMLSLVQCDAIAAEVTKWCMEFFSSPAEYDLELVVEFFDALSNQVRDEAMAWLRSDKCPAGNDPVLWARLIETPFDNVRLPLVEELQQRADFPGPSADALAPVWASVILGVHRGGRTKIKAVQQIRNAVAGDYSLADRLLPVLAVALRSVRKPERRAALAAIASLVEYHPKLATSIEKHLPELVLHEGETQVSS